MKEKKRFKVIECGGGFYEIGRQYGASCQDSLVSSIDSLFRDIGAFQTVDKERIIQNARKYLPLVENFDPDLIEMLKGQADGARVTFDEIFALRCKFELGMYYRRVMALCTSFAVTGNATRGGKTIIGQTYDLTPGISIDLVKTRFVDGMEQLSMVFAGGGAGELPLNSAGLGMALNVMLSPSEVQLLNVPCACVIPKAMRQKRIGDALGIVCAAGRSILHYGFASAEGDIIGIETWPNDYNVIQPERDMLVHTNHYLTERFKKGTSAFGFMEGDSYIRIQHLKRLMEKHYGELTVELLGEFMTDHNDYPRSICKHTDQQVQLGETLAAVIMVPEEGVLYATCGQPCQNEYIEYSLSSKIARARDQ
jgi:isopenicillin-N N-acyltransferase-like protein